MYRGWLRSLCPDLLKGPFNHEARGEVGLPRHWYDVDQWPEKAQQGMRKPQQASRAYYQGKDQGQEDKIDKPAHAASGIQVPDAAEHAQLRLDQRNVMHEANDSAGGGSPGGCQGGDTSTSDDGSVKKLDASQLEALRHRLLSMLGDEASMAQACDVS